MTFLYVFSMALTVMANVAYHFCQKEISPNLNPLVSLFFTYLSGMLIVLVCRRPLSRLGRARMDEA